MIYRTLVFLLAGVMAFNSPQAQCPLEVEAFGDTTLCEGGGSTPVEAVIVSGDPFDYMWSPAGIVDDPNSLSTIANVTGPVELVFTARCQGDNLIVNGNFEQGNTGFESDYIYSATDLVPEGVYTVTNDPNSVHPAFASCPDHTSGAGQMMVVNGETTPNAQVWCQTVDVIPGTQYVFETWITTVVANNPALLQFSINGILIGSVFQAPSTNCTWLQFYEVWNSNANTTAEICITNQNTVAAGNDFALDDIFFGAILPSSDTVQIDIAENVEGFLDTLVCEGEAVAVDGQLFSDPGAYQVNIPGGAANGCDSTVNLTLENIELDIQIQSDFTVSCENPLAEIDASFSTSGPNVFYQWATQDGNIVAGQGTPVILVDQQGFYTLTLIYDDGQIFCTLQSEDIFIQDIGESPEVEIVHIPELDCADSTGQILATTTVVNYAISWTSSDGLILDGENSLMPLIGSAGTYDLYLVDLDSGCDTLLSVQVDAALDQPVARVSGVGGLDCQADSILINASLSLPEGLEFQWVDSTGNSIGSDSVLWIDRAGIYRLIAVNPANLCKDDTVFTITDASTPPEYYLPDSLNGNCTKPFASLNYDAIDTSGGVLVTWIGDPLPRESDSAWIFERQGHYLALAMDTASACTDTASLFFELSQMPPQFRELPDSSLSCQRTLLEYTVEVEDTTIAPGYLWTNASGDVIDTSSTVSIGEPGVYTVEVTNRQNLCTARDTFEVRANLDIPVFQLSASGLFNCKTDTVLITANLPDTMARYFWNWSTTEGSIAGNSQTQNIRVLLPGKYAVEVTDSASGCSTVDSIIIDVDTTNPVVNAGADRTVDCQNPAVALTGSYSGVDSASITWESPDGLIDGPADNLEVTANGPGTYILSVTDLENGCAALDTLRVSSDEELPLIFPSPDTSLTCEVGSVNLGASYENAGGFPVVWWTTTNGQILEGDSTAMPLVGQAGEYRIHVLNSENGCESVENILVGLDTSAPSVIESVPPSINCRQDSVTIKLTSDPEAAGFSWESFNGSIAGDPDQAVITAVQPGDYRYTVTDMHNGCSTTGVIFVTADTSKPSAVKEPVLPLTCDQLSVELGFTEITPSTGITFEWMPPPGIDLIDNNTASIRVENGGIYRVLLTDTTNHCTSLYDFVVISDTSAPAAIAGGPENLNCMGEAVLDASASSGGPQITLDWSSPQGFPINQDDPLAPSISNPGIYVLTVVDDANGCMDRDTISVGPAAELMIELEMEAPTCNFPLARISVDTALNGLPPFQIAVDDPGNYMSADPFVTAEPGPHLIYVKDSRGCTAEISLSVADTTGISITLPPSFTLQPGEQLRLEPVLSIDDQQVEFVEWTPSGQLSCSNCLEPLLTAVMEEQLTVTVTDSGGCEASATTAILLEVNPRIYIPNAFSPNGDGINDIFRPYTDASITELISFEIYNRWGDRMHFREGLPIDNPDVGWNGYFMGGKMQPAVFVYHLKVRDILGGVHFRKGEVILLE